MKDYELVQGDPCLGGVWGLGVDIWGAGFQRLKELGVDGYSCAL